MFTVQCTVYICVLCSITREELTLDSFTGQIICYFKHFLYFKPYVPIKFPQNTNTWQEVNTFLFKILQVMMAIKSYSYQIIFLLTITMLILVKKICTVYSNNKFIKKLLITIFGHNLFKVTFLPKVPIFTFSESTRYETNAKQFFFLTCRVNFSSQGKRAFVALDGTLV